MRETKYMKALKNGKDYVEIKSQADKIKEFVIMGCDKKGNTFTTTANVKHGAEARRLGVGWAKSHGLTFERAVLVG